MNDKDFTTLTDQELIQEYKKMKSGKITTAVLIGLFVGIFAFSTIRNGFGFFTIFPLIFVFVLLSGDKKRKQNEKQIIAEMNVRNLKR